MSGSGNGSLDGATFDLSDENNWFNKRHNFSSSSARYSFSTYVVGQAYYHWELFIRIHTTAIPVDFSVDIRGDDVTGRLWLTLKRAKTWNPNTTLFKSSNTLSYNEIVGIAKAKCINFGLYKERGNNCQDWVNSVLKELGAPTHWTGYGGTVAAVFSSGLAVATCNIV